VFPISRDPPEGGTLVKLGKQVLDDLKFPISRHPPEGGTPYGDGWLTIEEGFPISRDPPEGGT